MKIVIENHTFKYETEKLCRIFLPDSSFDFVSGMPESGDFVFTSRSEGENSDTMTAFAVLDGKRLQSEKTVSHAVDGLDDACERQLAVALYEVLSALTGYSPAWGILTGVRPAKLMSQKIELMGEEKAVSYFTDTLRVSREKTELARTVSKAESAIVARSKPDSFSLYVSIPFCPTRCSYCSFVSHSNMSAKKLIPQYVDLLCREIALSGKMAEQLGLKLESVYYGGGTPTVLEAPLLERVMAAVNGSFETANAREYTVEAGRPDSITPEKLAVIKSGGATRISINPQTFNDSVLAEIGRQHTGQQTVDAFKMARSEGFNNINMDLIAGLPTDTAEGFERTLDKTLSLAPESITVHTLALKRSSEIVTAHKRYNDAKTVSHMLSSVQNRLPPLGYSPYYMYRQSKTVGNMENVGWCKTGCESIYNVFMMEESHTVFGVGGAAVTKLRAPHSTEIERIFNFKYPYEYIGRFDELVERKEYIKQFYENHPVKE